jgi:uncharacterized protein (TIGR03067 family)
LQHADPSLAHEVPALLQCSREATALTADRTSPETACRKAARLSQVAPPPFRSRRRLDTSLDFCWNHCRTTATTSMSARSLIITSLAFVALAITITTHAQLGRATAEPDVKKEFLGTWEGYMADADGSRHGDIKLEITAETITASNPRGGQIMGAGTYRISGATNKIKRIDAKGTSGQYQGKNYEGIFSIEGKTLKWCSANDRSKRPSDLKTDVRSGAFLMVLEKK